MNKPVLVVDLDGTLIRSDLLFETFLAALKKSWIIPILCLFHLLRGKAAMKEYLSAASNIDIAALPFNQKVLDRIKLHKESGGKVVLATASNEALASKVAEYLNLFDEVHGSTASQNLIGKNKAAFLEERYKDTEYYYIGDSSADVHVWKQSHSAIMVNCSKRTQRAVQKLSKPYEVLSDNLPRKRDYLKALRPHQWLKNILIFLPMLAAHRFDFATAWSSLLAFLAFSPIASSVYVLNDLLDLEADRSHPRKRLRPFASGAVPIVHGIYLALASLVLGCLIAGFLGWSFFLTVGAYYILTTAYSFRFKREVILDVCFLAGLYTVRIVAGGVATGIELSVWLFAFSIFFFFSLAAVKRQAELVDMAERGTLTAKGRGYHVEDLPIISMVGLAAGYISVLVMALYVNSPAVMELYVIPETLWGICCVLLYWLTRMVLVTHRGAMHDDPVVFAAKDRVSQICFVAMLSFAAAGVFL